MTTKKDLAPEAAPFDRGGLGSLADLQTPAWRELFGFLEQEQKTFLEQENKFRSPAYRWPRDPLHTWSRVWEYPYAYHHLRSWREKLGEGLPLAVDLGSGVTFFPFTVARLGYQVVCTDIDPVCEGDLRRASACLPTAPGRVDFRLCADAALPFADGEADVVYCISVLEHIPDFARTVQEVHRVLKPGGLFLLTIDLDLGGDGEIAPEPYRRLVDLLQRGFSPVYPERTIHPAELLHTGTGPFPLQHLLGLSWYWFLLKQRLLKPLLGRKPAPMFKAAVQGFVLEKRG